MNKKGKDKKLDEEELVKVSKFLKEDMMQELVRLLDSLVIIPLSSVQLRKIFHSSGINMRFLGVVASETSLLHVKEICVVEMIARTLKKMIH